MQCDLQQSQRLWLKQALTKIISPWQRVIRASILVMLKQMPFWEPQMLIYLF